MINNVKTISFFVGNGFDVVILKAFRSKHTATSQEYFAISGKDGTISQFSESVRELQHRLNSNKI